MAWFLQETARRPARRVLPPTCLETCLLYTSDAADERSSVDLGGRRIIKKKKKVEQQRSHYIQYTNTQYAEEHNARVQHRYYTYTKITS